MIASPHPPRPFHPPAAPPIRLGYVRYLNTLPLVEGLAACEQVALHAAVPSRLIDLLERDEIDVGLVSLIDAARAACPLALLPVGMIGCDGPTLTVRLFSSVPIDQVHTVHADTDSHTSVALVQVLLHALHGRRVRIIPYDAREHMPLGGGGRGGGEGHSETHGLRGAGANLLREGSDLLGEGGAMLLIGDKVVTDPPPAARYPYQLDLGEAWKTLTGLQFVYAVWMCRAERAAEPSVQLAAALLERQRLHNATRLDAVVSAHAASRAWPDDLAREYVGRRLRYDVTADGRRAAQTFIDMAVALGLCPPPPASPASPAPPAHHGLVWASTTCR